MSKDRGFEKRRRFLKLALAGVGVITSGCLPPVARSVVVEPAAPEEGKTARIGEVEMTQQGPEVQIVTRNAVIARRVEAAVAEACNATNRKAVDSKSTVRSLRVSVEDCINLTEVRKRINAFLN